MNNRYGYWLIGIFLIIFQTLHAQDSNALVAKSLGIQENKKLIKISPEAQKAAGIKTIILKLRTLPIYIELPGEVVPNLDLSAIVTPRIQAQVVERLAEVGESVKQGQPLARLTSVEMAKAQSDLLLAEKEWTRVKQLGIQAVSAKRYQTAEVMYQQAYSNLLAYGMTNTQIDNFIKSDNPKKANGDFTLLSPINGTVFSADFIQGKMITPGTVLFEIVDESSLWVDAKLTGGDHTQIKKGTKAVIETGEITLSAQVLQVHHKLDEITRTRIVRLNVPNSKDRLHPGEFVTCLIQIGQTSPLLAVDKNTIMRTQDNKTVVYVEVKPNMFMAKPVDVIKKIGDWRVISGVTVKSHIVNKGAFFVHSELLKSSFADDD